MRTEVSVFQEWSSGGGAWLVALRSRRLRNSVLLRDFYVGLKYQNYALQRIRSQSIKLVDAMLVFI